MGRTPTPDAAAILNRTAANLRDLRSARFELTHEHGSIFLSAFSAKITGVSGGWTAEQGAEFLIDIYLVAGHEADIDTGAYIQAKAVVTPNAYYSTDPLSGSWIRQSPSFAPIPVDELNHMMADVVDAVHRPVLEDRVELEGKEAYRVRGIAPAETMQWLRLRPVEDQTVQVVIWSDAAEYLLRKVQITGQVGQYDTAETVREIRLYDIGKPIAVEPPAEYVDLTGG